MKIKNIRINSMLLYFKIVFLSFISGKIFLVKCLKEILKNDDEYHLINKEGREILNDKDKRLKLRKFINNYHDKGVWDYSIFEEKQ